MERGERGGGGHNIMAADVSRKGNEEEIPRVSALNPDVAFDGGLN